jgi:hypothetical protein
MANVAFDQALRDNVPFVSTRARKTAKDAHHQPSVLDGVQYSR